ncbi:MAG TPA: GNAT family protein [Gaiellales bacterium]|nr:GNAT family protein [Gaiellales bacterium]
MPEVTLRPLEPDDAELLAAMYTHNRAFMAPFDPPRPPDLFTAAGQRRELDALVRDRLGDRRHRFLIEADGAPAGVISVSNLIRGPFQNASIGYWVARDLNGRGIATAAVGEVVAWAFGEAGLHRLEAGTLVDNLRSQAVLRRNRFRRIGRSARYLFIGGEWRDHLLFARTVED